MEPYQYIEIILEVANDLLETDDYSIKQMEAIKDFASALTEKFKQVQLEILENQAN